MTSEHCNYYILLFEGNAGHINGRDSRIEIGESLNIYDDCLDCSSARVGQGRVEGGDRLKVQCPQSHH